jgi:EpsI family protein
LGTKIDIKICYLVLLLLITCLFVYQGSGTYEGHHTGPKLKESLRKIEGYITGKDIPLEEHITTMLKLDDHIFTTYSNPNGSVILYIGHYYSLAKLTAAHSPLVCYPSQGWIIDEPVARQFPIGSDTLNYSELVATLGERKELILYWYQTTNKSSQNIFQIKIATLLNKLRNNNEQHGFVRVSIPFSGTDQDLARETGFTFIQAVWPHYLNYIEHNIPKK